MIDCLDKARETLNQSSGAKSTEKDEEEVLLKKSGDNMMPRCGVQGLLNLMDGSCSTSANKDIFRGFSGPR